MRPDRLRGPLLGATLLLTLGYLVLVGVLTLSPQPPPSGETGPLWWLTHQLRRLPGASGLPFDGVEFAANVLMFGPFGLFGVGLFGVGLFGVGLVGRRRWWLVLVAGIATTMIIETAQRAIPGRFPDPRDVVANTLGVALGIVSAHVVYAMIIRVRRRRAARSAAPGPRLKEER